MTRQLKASTRRELEGRGYRYTEAAPDLLVNFNASVTQQTRVHPGPMPYWGGYYGYGWPGYYGFWGGFGHWLLIRAYKLARPRHWHPIPTCRWYG